MKVKHVTFAVVRKSKSHNKLSPRQLLKALCLDFASNFVFQVTNDFHHVWKKTFENFGALYSCCLCESKMAAFNKWKLLLLMLLRIQFRAKNKNHKRFWV